MASDPQEIQREIEATRAELAATVEQIADKVSPKKVAARGAAAAKESVKETANKAKDTAENVFAPVTEPAPAVPAPLTERMKWERVAAAGVAVGLLVLAIVKVKGRKS